MNARTWGVGAGFGLCAALALGQALAAGAAAEADAAFARLEQRYVRDVLRRHPVVSTYLGGAGLYPELAATDGRLRDWSGPALSEEAEALEQVRRQLAAMDPARLSPARRIDREVILHQIAFQLHQGRERKYWQRCLDTYVNEAFRGVDWYTQGMADQGGGRYGSEAEWRTVAARVAAVAPYPRRARDNLQAGVRSGNVPDPRMVERDGLGSSEANAVFFETTLPEMAAARSQGQPFSAAVVAELRARGGEAARGFREFRGFVERSLAVLPRRDRYALGEKEYDWALGNNLNVPFTAAQLWEESWAAVQKTREALIATAEAVAKEQRLGLAWDAGLREASTRAVFDVLAKDAPRSDEEMTRWYQDACQRLVAFARRHDLFEIPADYRLEVTVTPPTLEASIDGAAYYPAPPFKDAGVGRFYVTPTKGDPERLKRASRASIADLAAHEGFPGHDWHFKAMTRFRDRISPVRWLTPGEVEGSASMWQDSMAAEGWGLYAEHLMGEPVPGAPDGFYTLAERLHQLRALLVRDLRVRLDTGLHTERLGFDAAVDLFSETVDFLPGPCAAVAAAPEKKASCDAARRAIFRYSKWPTQAITYRLGKDRILDLRARAERLVPGHEGRKRFHALFLQQGTISPGYFEELLLAEMAPGRPGAKP